MTTRNSLKFQQPRCILLVLNFELKAQPLARPSDPLILTFINMLPKKLLFFFFFYLRNLTQRDKIFLMLYFSPLYKLSFV
jgi:hypothetical protein